MIKEPNKDWKEWVRSAYGDMVCLSAIGFYRTQGLDYNMKTNSGKLFNYYTYGVGFSKVEVDCLTGDHTVLKTDISMEFLNSETQISGTRSITTFQCVQLQLVL